MEQDKISVIMGAYNIAHLSTFEKAVESILIQTHSNLEFVICNDGSTDSTQEKLESLAAQDDRIRVLQSPQNEGLGAALNHCIAAATGLFLARQDADDISQPARLEEELLFLRRHEEIAFVGTDIALYDEAGVWGERRFPAFPRSEDFLFTMPFVHGTLMFRRAALSSVGGYRVARETRRAEDYDLLMRLYAHGLTGANLPKKYYLFLEDANAMQRRKYKDRLDEVVVRYRGFQALHLLPKGIPYLVKPLLVGLLPHSLLKLLKSVRHKYIRPF